MYIEALKKRRCILFRLIDQAARVRIELTNLLSNGIRVVDDQFRNQPIGRRPFALVQQLA